KGNAMVLRFGEHVEGTGRETVAGLELKIEMRGDIETGKLRRWRITKTFTPRQASLLAIQLDVVLTLAGDLDSDFVKYEGRAGLAMMRSVITDARAVIEGLRPKKYSAVQGPIVHAEVRVAGEIATGRCGLVPTAGGRPIVSPEARAARLVI